MKDQSVKETKSFARWTVLSVTTLSSFMAALDANIVTIALPKISHDFSSGVSILGWVISAYILATAMLLLQAGKIGDWYGKKKVYLLGFVLFGIASALCGISQNTPELILFRIIQGIASAIFSATSAPLVFESFPPSERGAALGINGIAWAIGAITGPVLGGFLVAVDWRLIFYINVPVAAAAVLLATRRIPSSPPKRPAIEGRSKIGINLVSSIFVALTVASMLLWLTLFNSVFALIGIISLIILILSEKKSTIPLLNIELRRNRGFIYSVSALGVFQTAFLAIPFALSLYFQSILGYSPIITGLSIAPLPVFLGLVNPLGGRLVDRLKKPAIISIIGALIIGISTIALGFEMGSKTFSPIYTGALLALIGGSDGLVWTPTIVGIMKFAKSELRGVANGTAFMMSNIGFAASIAILVAISATFLPSAAISQIYLGNLSNLTSTQALLFKEGISRALVILGLIDFAATPLLFMIYREQGI
ncbi:MAG: MFS transporter [Nitrososphaerales archaeon]